MPFLMYNTKLCTTQTSHYSLIQGSQYQHHNPCFVPAELYNHIAGSIPPTTLADAHCKLDKLATVRWKKNLAFKDETQPNQATLQRVFTTNPCSQCIIALPL